MGRVQGYDPPMGLAELDRIDIVANDEDGGERWISVAGSGWPVADEARLIALFLIKMANLWRHAAHQETPIRMELVSMDEPPICVLEIAERKGMAVTVGIEDRRPAHGRPTGFPNAPDGWPDIDALQQANAREIAKRRDLPLPPTLEALDELDAVLAERREDAGVGEDDESDEAFDGDLVVLAGAYAGEAIRAQVGGRWTYDPEAELMNPIHLVIGESKINVLGKAGKFLRSGPSDSVASLASMVVQMRREKQGV